MQGKKIYQEKLFNSYSLSSRVPENNFYRGLKGACNFDFLYKLTEDFYGSSGQKRIDPVVFFKLCSVGYLKNITSDRKIMDHCSMRLDIMSFMGLRKINTIGIRQANKVMHLSAIAYNLKKCLKFGDNRVKSEAESLVSIFFPKAVLQKWIGPLLKNPNPAHFWFGGKNKAA